VTRQFDASDAPVSGIRYPVPSFGDLSSGTRDPQHDARDQPQRGTHDSQSVRAIHRGSVCATYRHSLFRLHKRHKSHFSFNSAH
jgi:hypothetical protein